MDISKPKCKYCIVNQKTIKELENTMWVLQSGKMQFNDYGCRYGMVTMPKHGKYDYISNWPCSHKPHI